MKKVLIAALTVLFLTGAGLYFFYFMPMQKEIEAAINEPIENIDIASLEDGIYQGSHTDYSVEVTVGGHKIQDIRITKNRNSAYAKKAEGIVEHVKDKQSLQVDLVSGASSTSKGILRAIENALQSAPE